MSSTAKPSLATTLVSLLLASGCALTAPSVPGLPSATTAASASTATAAGSRPSATGTKRHPTPASATSAASATPVASPTAAPSPAASSGTPLAGRTIVIDPGHNGGWTAKFGYAKVPDGNGHRKACNSSGTATAAGFAEHAYNWDQANALADVLRKRGATVRFTRDNDRGKGPCVNKRSSLANSLHADLLLSIHADGNLGTGHRGFHVIMSPAQHGGRAVYAKSRALAADLRDAVQTEAGLPRSNYIGKGTAFSVRTDLGTLNFAQVPAVMMEMGNMRNARDAALFTSKTWRTKAANALADGIEKFLH